MPARYELQQAVCARSDLSAAPACSGPVGVRSASSSPASELKKALGEAGLTKLVEPLGRIGITSFSYFREYDMKALERDLEAQMGFKLHPTLVRKLFLMKRQLLLDEAALLASVATDLPLVLVDGDGSCHDTQETYSAYTKQAWSKTATEVEELGSSGRSTEKRSAWITRIPKGINVSTARPTRLAPALDMSEDVTLGESPEKPPDSRRNKSEQTIQLKRSLSDAGLRRLAEPLEEMGIKLLSEIREYDTTQLQSNLEAHLGYRLHPTIRKKLFLLKRQLLLEEAALLRNEAGETPSVVEEAPSLLPLPADSDENLSMLRPRGTLAKSASAPRLAPATAELAVTSVDEDSSGGCSGSGGPRDVPLHEGVEDRDSSEPQQKTVLRSSASVPRLAPVLRLAMAASLRSRCPTQSASVGDLRAETQGLSRGSAYSRTDSQPAAWVRDGVQQLSRPQSACNAPMALGKQKGWTSSNSLVQQKSMRSFKTVEDCTLSRSDLLTGIDGGGGLRVRPMQLFDIDD